MPVLARILGPMFETYRKSSITERPIAAQTGITTNGNSASLAGYGNAGTIRALLNVTALTGTTPNLTVSIEDSLDGGTTWTNVASFTAVTATGAQALNITTPFGELLRIRWVITGTTPSANFTVDWAVGQRL